MKRSMAMFMTSKYSPVANIYEVKDMPIARKAGRKTTAMVGGDQVCARGWQDYMLETRHYMGEARVEKCLRSMNERQLSKLGLGKGEVSRLKVR
jgi:hypothetical protein